VDETLVTVHANPYFLRLNFPKAILEDDDSSAQYDPSAGNLTVTLTKENAGEAFDDLDLLAKLLAPRKTPIGTTTNIEVISSSDDTENELEDLSSKTGFLSLEDDEATDGQPPASHVVTKVNLLLQQKMTGISLKIFLRIQPCGPLCRLNTAS